MKKWNFSLLFVSVLILILSCNHSIDTHKEMIDPMFDAKISVINNGAIDLSPQKGLEGTQITVFVNPDPGYKIAPNGLKFHVIGVSTLDKSNMGLIKENECTFDMPSGGAWISASFIKAENGEYTISSDPVEHGKVKIYPLYGKSGDAIEIKPVPDAGFTVKDGFPKVNGVTITNSPPYKFNLPNENVRVQVEFARDDFQGLLENAKKYLDAGDYDSAAQYYEQAYVMDNFNTEAAIYSSLAKIASIFTDPKSRRLIKTFGFNKVPGSLNEWADESLGTKTGWLDDYEGDILPAMSPPQGFPMGFLNYTVYQQNHLSSGKPARVLFDILLFWNTIASNPNGFNDILRDIETTFFSDAFRIAEERVARLNYADTIEINNTLRQKFRLNDFYSAGDHIGRAELEIILSWFYALKAALQWSSAYNWDMDLSALRIPIDKFDKLNDIIKTIFEHTLKDYREKTGNYSALYRILPFRSRFMKDLDNGMMSSSKNSFVKSIKTFTSAVPYLASTAKNVLHDNGAYAWVLDGIVSLQNEIESGGVFYFPKQFPLKGERWDFNAVRSDYGISMQKFFTQGFLSLEKLITINNLGKTPIFFGIHPGIPASIDEKEDLIAYTDFSFEMSSNFKSVFVKAEGKSADQYKWLSDIYPKTSFTKTTAEYFIDAYQNR